MSARKDFPEIQTKIAGLLAEQYAFDVLIMAAILSAPDEQSSLYLLSGFRDQGQLLLDDMNKKNKQPKAGAK